MIAENCESDKHNGTATVENFDKTKSYKTCRFVPERCCGLFLPSLPTWKEIKQYIGVILCGLSLWGSSWFLLKDVVAPGGFIFHMAGTVIVGYVFGHIIERYTSLNCMVGMTIIGALSRNLFPYNFLENPIADVIDLNLRRIYPVIILTKGPLSWNWEYIKSNSLKVFSLATLPWIVECLSTALVTHVLLGFPWYWGVHLGSILASVSPAVVVPTATKQYAHGFGTKNQIALLVGNAGGLDTAFTEGMFGVINTAIFYPSTLTYRIIKAALAIFLGIGLGILWGVLADSVPDQNDPYAPTVRSLLIFGGGYFVTCACGYLGWGGISGVAIMVCVATAATRWARRGWLINNNPVSEVYKILWLIFEPMLFTLSGYFLDVSQISLVEFGLILGCIFAALFFRLLTAFLVCLANELSVKESLFVSITWIPKAIVENTQMYAERVTSVNASSIILNDRHRANNAFVKSRYAIMGVCRVRRLGAQNPMPVTKFAQSKFTAPQDLSLPSISLTMLGREKSLLMMVDGWFGGVNPSGVRFTVARCDIPRQTYSGAALEYNRYRYYFNVLFGFCSNNDNGADSVIVGVRDCFCGYLSENNAAMPDFFL